MRNDYDFVEDDIIVKSDNNVIKDVNIRKLDIFARHIERLNDAGIYMLSDILKMSDIEISKKTYLNMITVNDILSIVKRYMQSHKENDKECEAKKMTQLPLLGSGYYLKDGLILDENSGKTYRNALFPELQLSVRAYNCLYRTGMTLISDILQLTREQLSQIRNIGKKSGDEIIEKLYGYFNDKNIVTDTSDSLCKSKDDNNTIFEPMNSIEPVIAPDYAVIDGVIYYRGTFKTIDDIDVRRLDLSVRSVNCLTMNGIRHVSEVIGMKKKDFMRIRNLGKLSYEEIIVRIDEYLDSMLHNSNKPFFDNNGIPLLQSDVFEYFKRNKFDLITIDELKEYFSGCDVSNIDQQVDLLVKNGTIIKENENYCMMLYSIFDCVNENKQISERAKKILNWRFDGRSLQDIGTELGISRERVRQIEQRALDKITTNGKTVFYEDRYEYMFTKFSPRRDVMINYLDIDERTVNYLYIRYENWKIKLKPDFANAVDDKRIPVDVRQKIIKFYDSGEFFNNAD